MIDHEASICTPPARLAWQRERLCTARTTRHAVVVLSPCRLLPLSRPHYCNFASQLCVGGKSRQKSSGSLVALRLAGAGKRPGRRRLHTASPVIPELQQPGCLSTCCGLGSGSGVPPCGAAIQQATVASGGLAHHRCCVMLHHRLRVEERRALGCAWCRRCSRRSRSRGRGSRRQLQLAAAAAAGAAAAAAAHLWEGAVQAIKVATPQCAPNASHLRGVASPVLGSKGQRRQVPCCTGEACRGAAATDRPDSLAPCLIHRQRQQVGEGKHEGDAATGHREHRVACGRMTVRGDQLTHFTQAAGTRCGAGGEPLAKVNFERFSFVAATLCHAALCGAGQGCQA